MPDETAGRRAPITVATAVMVALLVGILGHPGASAQSPDQGEVAFVSTRSGDPEVFAMDAAGGSVRALTDNPAWEADPAWSPDGSRLAFSSDMDGDEDIYVYELATGALANITNASTGAERQPDWSHDGRSIAYVRDGSVFITGAAGGTERLVDGGNAPALSPVDDRIAFVRGGDIFVKQAPDGGPAQRLTRDAQVDSIDWAPDGRRLVLSAAGLSPGGGNHLYRLRLSDGAIVQLTADDLGEDHDPSWSPAGTAIVFTRIGVTADLFTVRPDGTGEAILLGGEEYDFQPAWGGCSMAACPAPTGSPTSTASPTTSPSPTGTSPDPSPTTSPGERTQTTMDVRSILTLTRARAFGSLEPGRAGLGVDVLLQKRRGGRWRLVAARRVVTEADGSYRARFIRRVPGASRCRLRGVFPGTSELAPSADSTRPYSC